MGTGKNLSKFILSTILFFILVGNFVFADTIDVPVLNNRQNVYDEANLYSDDTEAYLNKVIERIQNNYNADLVFVTVNSLNGLTSEKFADDYFHYNGFGRNQNNGIVFLVAPADRDWAISTNGDTIQTFTDAGQKYIMDEVLKYLKKDDYDNAAMVFANYAEDFYKQDAKGKAYDEKNMPFKLGFVHYGISLVTSLVIAVGVSAGFTSQLKSVRNAANASNYQETSNVDILRERFVTTSVISRKIDKGSSSSGGGSTTHSSSGGISGGSSGKY